jgi:spermidine/putrescine transport system permease protein
MTKIKKYISSHPHLSYIGPISVWTLVFIIGPLLVIFYFSFLEFSSTGQILNTFTLKHYAALFDPSYFTILIRTLAYGFGTNVICLLLGYPLAYWVTKYGGRWKTLLIFLIILPSWTCYLIRIYALKTLIAYNGLINRILLDFGIISSPIDILYTPYAVVLALIFTWLPFMILPIYASLEGLDPSLLEASLDLGATPRQRFFTITLPLTRGGIIAGTILVFIPVLGEWLIPALLGGAKVMMAGNLVTLYFLTAGNIPAGSSIAAVLTTTIILILYLCIKFGGEESLERIV